MNGKRFWQSLKGGAVNELAALVSTFEKERFERLENVKRAQDTEAFSLESIEFIRAL